MLHIELTGPMGNAHHIVAQAMTFARQLDWSQSEIDGLLNRHDGARRHLRKYTRTV